MQLSSKRVGLIGRFGTAALMAVALWFAAVPARAAIVLGPGSAVKGSEVSLRVSGSFTVFSSASLAVSYKSNYLSFLRAEAADYALDLTSPYWTQNTLDEVWLNINLDPAAAPPAPGLENYFKLVFKVNDVAPGGDTEVELLDRPGTDPSFVFDTPSGFQEVRIDDLPGGRVLSTVTTLPGATVLPIGDTLALVLPALGLLALGRRRPLVAQPA